MGATVYPSPLVGYENLPPLSNERNADGKSLVNPSADNLSDAYTRFADPLNNGERGGFDIHVYFLQTAQKEREYAYALHERIRREFPELRVYSVFDRPVGPHPVGMFEVNVFSPAQFGALVAWLAVRRGPLSVLVHPNTDDELRDHERDAIWMGRPYPLELDILADVVAAKKGKDDELLENLRASKV